METSDSRFSSAELKLLEEICRVSEKVGLEWVEALTYFPAQTPGEKFWKERTLAGIRMLDKMGNPASTRVGSAQSTSS